MYYVLISLKYYINIINVYLYICNIFLLVGYNSTYSIHVLYFFLDNTIWTVPDLPEVRKFFDLSPENSYEKGILIF